MKGILITVYCSLLASLLLAIPPKPPVGKRWVLNPTYSDEFNGTQLDASKWYNYHPQWKGRAPAIFLPSQVSVADGYLQIKNKKLSKDTIITNWNGTTTTYSMAGGAVRSKTDNAFYGYYECRFKASKTHMSTTFWMSSAQSKPGPLNCASGDDKYGLELDIQETIGVPDLAHTPDFHTGMGSNTHYWYTDCDGVQHDYNKGVKTSSTAQNSDVFNIYGAWWKDATEADFVFNDNTPKEVKFNTTISPTPFDYSMAINMVTETYSWITLPTDAELADNSGNTSYYDWIRSYTLVDATDPNIAPAIDPNLAQNGNFETGDLTSWTGWGTPGANIVNGSENVYSGNYAVHILGAGAPEQLVNLKTNTNYTLTCYAKAVTGSITLGVKVNSTGLAISTTEVTDNQYKTYTVKFNSGQNTDLKFYFYAQAGEEGYADNFELIDDSEGSTTIPTAVLALYTENVYLSKEITKLPVSKSLSIPYTFMANEDRNIHFELKNSQNITIKDTTVLAYAGYANTQLNITLAEMPAAQAGYTLYATIRPLNSTDSEKIKSDQIPLEFTITTSVNTLQKNNAPSLIVYPNPANDQLFVKDSMDGSPYSIYDLMGHLIKSGTLSENPIQTGRLKKGRYILQLKNDQTVFIKN